MIKKLEVVITTFDGKQFGEEKQAKGHLNNIIAVEGHSLYESFLKWSSVPENGAKNFTLYIQDNIDRIIRLKRAQDDLQVTDYTET